VSETPVFSEIAAKNKAARSPVVEAVKKHPREFLVVLGARLAENGLGYLFPVFALSYMTQQLHLPKGMILQGNMLAYAIQLLAIPLFAMLSDRIGRRPVYMGGAIFSALFAFPFFMLVNTQSQPLIYLGLILGVAVGVGAMFGPQAAYFAEMFGARLRYSGFAFARELGSILRAVRTLPSRVAANMGRRATLGRGNLYDRSLPNHRNRSLLRTGDLSQQYRC
jgi:hypothetical protein